MDEIKEVEYKLDYTQVYNEYKVLFEQKIIRQHNEMSRYKNINVVSMLSACILDISSFDLSGCGSDGGETWPKGGHHSPSQKSAGG